MSTRCRILAHLIPGFRPADVIMACPTGLYGTHYHAATAQYSPLAGRVPCPHRHQSVNAALACCERLHASVQTAARG